LQALSRCALGDQSAFDVAHCALERLHEGSAAPNFLVL